MSNFTPGPWMARDEYIYTKDKTIVIDGHDTGMLIRIGSADIGNRMSVDMALANARIMAAAPEMYELIEDLYNRLLVLTDPEWADLFIRAGDLLWRIEGKEEAE